jgi:hypothetical protein
MRNRNCRFLILLSFSVCVTTTAFARQGSPTPTGLLFYTVGEAEGIIDRFGKDFYEVLDELNENEAALGRFLLSIAEEPLTEKQIEERSAISRFLVKRFISQLSDIKVILKDEQGRWATTLPVITDRQMRAIRKDITPMASSVARYMKREMLKLEPLYGREKSPFDPSWEKVTHLLIDKFIIDGTFHSAIQRGEQPGRKHRNTTPAFFLEWGENFSLFGTNWYAFNQDGDQREVYILHGGVLDRHAISMNRYRGDQDFASILFKITPDGGINSLADQEKSTLRSLQWVTEERLLVPAVQAETIKSLRPTMEKIGNEAAEVAFEHISDLTQSFTDSPYSKFSEESEDYIQVCYHVLFGVLIEQLEVQGVVSPIPRPVPEHFGAYLVIGKVF